MTSLWQAGNGWRETVLAYFSSPSFHPLSLVPDPDGLLLEEQVLAAFNARGCELLTFDDPIAFRYLYETRYRDQPAPALIVRTGQADVRQLPYDLLRAGRQLSLTLHDLCPQLSYPVLRDFFRAAPDLLDALLDASRATQGERLSEQRSLWFLARHVYGLDPASLVPLDDLVERLLHIHYHGWTLPERLQGWLVGQLRQSPALADQPIERWLADRHAFFIFLEDQWRSYLRQQGQTLGQSESLAEPGPVYELSPLAMDFSRPGIRSRVDTLFLENKLRPALVIAERPPQDWTAVGVTVNAAAHRSQRLARLLTQVDHNWPGPDASVRAWLDLAPAWAEALTLAEAAPLAAELHGQFTALQQRLAVDFPAWLHARYDALHSLPYLPQPILGHQVAHFLAHRLRQDAASARVALLVLDGLALDQQQIVRNVWQEAGQPWRCDEQTLLAVLPTVTPIARQALFAGQLPLYFPDTWQRTDQDGRRWQRFWQDQGLPPSAAAWQLGSEQLDHALADGRVRALGLMLSSVDKMLHGTVHGRAELHARVRHWLARGELTQVVQRILAAGFDLWLTSDHGNTAAVGVGRPREGVLVEQRGSRVRFYNDPAFQARAAGEVAEALAWTPGGLPAGLLTLIAAGHNAFVNQGEHLMTHGGLALEEVIVPWVHITTGSVGDRPEHRWGERSHGA